MSDKLFSNASNVEESLVWNPNTLDVAVIWYVDYILWFLYLVAVLFILYSGFQILTAADQDDKKDNWKTTFKISLIAIVIIFIADPIINWIIGSIISWNIEENWKLKNESEYIQEIND